MNITLANSEATKTMLLHSSPTKRLNGPNPKDVSAEWDTLGQDSCF
jgi:hypothetical protein